MATEDNQQSRDSDDAAVSTDLDHQLTHALGVDNTLSDEGWRLLFDRIRPRLVLELKRAYHVSSSDADEAFDEAISQLLAGNWRSVRSPTAYLKTVATRRVIDDIRKRAQHGKFYDEQLLQRGRLGFSEDTYPFEEWPDDARVSVFEAINKLKNPQRVILTLKYHLGWTVREIADALQMSSSTVFLRMSEGIRAIQRALGNSGFTQE